MRFACSVSIHSSLYLFLSHAHSGVAGDTLLPPSETGAAATGTTPDLLTATDATAADTATAATTAAVTSDSNHSEAVDSGASA